MGVQDAVDPLVGALLVVHEGRQEHLRDSDRRLGVREEALYPDFVAHVVDDC